MCIKHWKWRLSCVFLILLMSIYLSGCQTDELPAVTVSSSGTSESFQKPRPENQETNTVPKSSEAPNEMPAKTQPAPELSSQPTPEQKSEDAPIHPFYGLDGTPPSAPGLAMRRREFDAEPEKIAYLTFDDGPHPQTTPRILKILKNEGVKATFFVIGRQVEQYPDLLKAEFDQGQGIGNHSYSHDYSSVYPSPAPSPEAFLKEIKQAEEVIYKTIGVRPRIIRAPGGTQNHFHVNYYNALDAADYLVFDWNVSSGDAAASLVPSEQLIQNIKTQVPNKQRVIILMHDTGVKTTTVDALPQIIQFLKQQGYSFGILTDKVAPILFPGGFNDLG